MKLKVYRSSLLLLKSWPLLLALLVFPFLSPAQEGSGTEGAVNVRTSRKMTDQEIRKLQGKMSVPAKAALYAVVFPGGGQIYNKKYWKIPILFTGLAWLGSVASTYHEEYIEARNNLAYLADDDPTNNNLIDDRFESFDTSNFVDRRDRFRRERDYYIILSVLWYAIGVADATVDAHLREFNVSDDLSLRIKPHLEPMVRPGEMPVMATGVKFSFSVR